MTKKKAKKKAIKKKAKKIKTPTTEKTPAPKVVPIPTAGPKVTDFEKELDRQLASDGPPKRGPGRPRKDQPPAEPDRIGPALELVVNFIKLPFELWQIRVPEVPGLALSDKEARQIGQPAKELIEYYMPKVPAIAYAWASLGVTAFWIMRSRMLSIEEVRKEKQQGSAPTGSPTGGKVTERGTKAQGGAGPSGSMPSAAAITEQIKTGGSNN